MIPTPIVPGLLQSQYLIFELLDLDHGTQPLPSTKPIFPYLMMHANPTSFEISYTKLVNRQKTRGGYLEQVWGEEITGVSGSGSTGIFLSVQSGVSVLNRKSSIAYRKHLELVDMFTNNGAVYDSRGNLIFHGGINLHFKNNIYTGYFESLTVTETADSFYKFDVSFEFKIERALLSMGR